MVLLKLSALMMAPSGQTGRQRQCVLNLFDSLSVHPSVNKLVKTIFWKWLNWFDANWHKWSTGKGVKRSALRSVGQSQGHTRVKLDSRLDEGITVDLVGWRSFSNYCNAVRGSVMSVHDALSIVLVRSRGHAPHHQTHDGVIMFCCSPIDWLTDWLILNACSVFIVTDNGSKVTVESHY